MKGLTIALLLPILVFGQELEFLQEWDTIPLMVNGYSLPAPWTRGYGKSSPDLVDIDGDGDFDMVVGKAGYGQIDFWRNDGTSQQEHFILTAEGLQTIEDQASTGPEFCDFDSDGDFDLFLYTLQSGIQVYENIWPFSDAKDLTEGIIWVGDDPGGETSTSDERH